MPLELIHQPEQLHASVGQLRRADKRVGLVPTMGALHPGHMSLVEASRAECDATVVTIFVNPLQFGPEEDFERYPRTLNDDRRILEEAGVEILFCPPSEAMYPAGFSTFVEVSKLTDVMEGASRPTHFRGVATVVLKLLNMAGADVAYFGQKDYQQAMVIRQMIRDLNVPTDMRICPIFREDDGVAMSSRNRYLSKGERYQARLIHNSLVAAREMVATGHREAEKIVEKMKMILSGGPDLEIDYVKLTDPLSLREVTRIDGETLAAVAVTIGETRLIDNCLIPDPRAR
jgi:pantoate--beta-alanine ligase